jgi:hypothetical protein
MRTLASFLVLIVAVLLRANTANADTIFKAILTGDQEVPPVDTQAVGRVKIRVNDTLTAAEVSLTVFDGVRVQQAHIHCAPAGANGPVVVWFAGMRAEGWDIDGEWISNLTFTDANVIDPTCGTTVADIVQAMINGNVYANVHTVAHPGGEIRGQVAPVSCPGGGN